MFIGETIGPFKIERELGSGVMGTVYRAIYQPDDEAPKTIALKIVSLGLLGNEGAMARFDREAHILKQMRHPNIVRLFATGRYKKTPFIAMEFVDGEPLDRALTRRGRLGWEEVVGYTKQLCLALQFAHDKGVIHRDLKPSNLMITREGILKLADFGIAKDQDVTALTGMNSTIGTAAYMSPEQCKGDKNLSGKSDLYSLGICMYELIVGRKPFTAENTVDMFLKHVHEKPVRPTRLVQDLPVWVETLILHLLEKDKDKRPLDAATVLKSLEDIEQKIIDQESAGVAVANARRIDRKLGDAGIDEGDKETARMLRDNKPGKRKKKRPKEATTPQWQKLLPPALGLLTIAGLIFYLARPEGPEKHFAKVTSAVGVDDRITEAGKFLDRFGARGGESVDKARAILKEARGQKLDTILDKRFNSKGLRNIRGGEDDEAYVQSWAALEAEQKGDLGRAADFWQKVRSRAPEAQDDYADGWAWLAERHLADLKAVDDHARVLQQELRDFQILNPPWKFDAAEPKALALTAVRLGGLGGPPSVVNEGKPIPILKDDAKIAKTWSDLAELTREKPAQRSWYLLATREGKNFGEIKPQDALAVRRTAVPAQVERIRAEWVRVVSDPNLEVARRDCRNRARDLVELFSDETDGTIRTALENAKKLLDEMNARKSG